ncbi:DUF5710 domain-containing protein [Priestia endophytica]|uniref:DUF5710 domain-containing protein n=1 Tax=Priestia endophytica TaxID=135735 RepID=UPI00124EB7C4|nr:DUF5710 domain-containing protein [Priestia endophytica]KAB2495593.1 DNA primase [Priestia endophytica]
MLYLNVPYEQKNEVKSMYARWDKDKKKWYATNPKFYFRFTKWIEGESVAQNKVYIAVNSKICWKCKGGTPVYTFAVKSEDLIDIINRETNIEEFTGYDVVLIQINRNLPKGIKKYLVQHTNCKDKFSKTTQTTYFANACIHCDALQGINYVYDEVNAPFSGINSTGSNPIRYIEFKLKNDIAIDYQVGEATISPPVKLFNEKNVSQSDIELSE